MTRYVRKDRRIYDFSTCRLCGHSYGVVQPEIEHSPTTCMACGSRQCMGNGLARGQCSICYIGLLPGWSGNDKPCGYKRCTGQAVAHIGGQVHYACAAHLAANRKYGSYIADRLAEREKSWELVEESPLTPYGAK